MSDYPWYMQLFNMELFEQKKKLWEEEAKAKGMSLDEYIDTKMIKLDELREDEDSEGGLISEE